MPIMAGWTATIPFHLAITTTPSTWAYPPCALSTIPGHAEKSFADHTGATLIVSPDGRDSSLQINQDARIWQLRFDAATQNTRHDLEHQRTYYLHVATGDLTLNGIAMTAGDGAALKDESHLDIEGTEATQALLFDLPHD